MPKSAEQTARLFLTEGVQKSLAPSRWFLLSQNEETSWSPSGTAVSSVVPDSSSPTLRRPELLPARTLLATTRGKAEGFLPVVLRELFVFVAATATAPFQLPVKSPTTRNPLLLLCSDPCLSPGRCAVGGPEPRSGD